MPQRALPERRQCYQMLRQYHVPEHIIGHCAVVAAVAVELGNRLGRLGADVDIELLERSALLHDILRPIDFNGHKCDHYGENPPEAVDLWQKLRAQYAGMGHEEAAQVLLQGQWPELGATVGKHRYLAIYEQSLYNWNEKLLYYADKRVMHDKVVSVKQRLADGRKRNGNRNPALTEKVDALIYELEDEIFEKLDIDPEQLSAVVDPAEFEVDLCG